MIETFFKIAKLQKLNRFQKTKTITFAKMIVYQNSLIIAGKTILNLQLQNHFGFFKQSIDVFTVRMHF